MKNYEKIDAILSQCRYNPANLTGPHCKATRKELLELLQGQKVLAKNCGINELMRYLYSIIPLKDHTCQAHRESLLTFALAKLLNPANHAKMVETKNARLLVEIKEAEEAGEKISYIAFLKNKLTE